MVAHDRIRLIGLLRESPASAGLFYDAAAKWGASPVCERGAYRNCVKGAAAQGPRGDERPSAADPRLRCFTQSSHEEELL